MTSTHNWVLNTIVRSWNATLAAKPKPSPRTMTKMKVMIQIICKKKATHTLQTTLIQVQRLRSRAMRKHEFLRTTVEVGNVQEKELPPDVISQGLNHRNTSKYLKNPERVYPLLIPSLNQLTNWLSLSQLKFQNQLLFIKISKLVGRANTDLFLLVCWSH